MKPIVYYAHHLWKYGTQTELEEISLIKKKFDDSVIINPNGWINQCGDEEYIKNQCLTLVKVSDVLVFSAWENNTIGKGVYSEIEYALNNGKKVFFLCEGVLVGFNKTDFLRIDIINPRYRTDRIYAKII